jgi:hypothetical protein
MAGVFYVDAGDYARRGVIQICLYDPSGNLIEINEDKTLAGTPQPDRMD